MPVLVERAAYEVRPAEPLARVLLVDEIRAWQECVAFGTVPPDESLDHFRLIVTDYRARERAAA